MIKINNKAIAVPTSCSIDISDIDGESNRNAKGEMIRDRIAVKRKINLEWKYLSLQELSVILKAVDDEFFSVSYPDPKEGKVITKRFYVGDRSAACYNYKMNLWENLKFNLVEK